MASSADSRSMTAEEFLRWEETQLERHELVDGQMREMGAVEIWPDMSAEHDLVVHRVGVLLVEHLKATAWDVFFRDPGNPTSPDVEVRCGSKRWLIFEVMTPQSAFGDHGDGFSPHRSRSEVQAIVQIDLAHRRGDMFQRYCADGNKWVLHSFESGGAVVLTSIDLSISVDALFEGLGPTPVPLYRSDAEAT